PVWCRCPTPGTSCTSRSLISSPTSCSTSYRDGDDAPAPQRCHARSAPPRRRRRPPVRTAPPAAARPRRALARGPPRLGRPMAGGTGPTSPTILTVADESGRPPDPWALAELSRDVRPPDYATSFARQALQLSGVSWPFAVCATLRPPWLAAVASEPGVLEVGL